MDALTIESDIKITQTIEGVEFALQSGTPLGREQRFQVSIENTLLAPLSLLTIHAGRKRAIVA